MAFSRYGFGGPVRAYGAFTPKGASVPIDPFNPGTGASGDGGGVSMGSYEWHRPLPPKKRGRKMAGGLGPRKRLRLH